MQVYDTIMSTLTSSSLYILLGVYKHAVTLSLFRKQADENFEELDLFDYLNRISLFTVFLHIFLQNNNKIANFPFARINTMSFSQCRKRGVCGNIGG